jgi:hypothetical protein
MTTIRSLINFYVNIIAQSMLVIPLLLLVMYNLSSGIGDDKDNSILHFSIEEKAARERCNPFSREYLGDQLLKQNIIMQSNKTLSI